MPLTYRFPPGQGMLSRILSVVVLLVIFTVAFFLGTVLLLVILGAIAVSAVALYLRFWWLRRQMKQHPQGAPGGGVTLEGEYTVTKSEKPSRTDERQ